MVTATAQLLLDLDDTGNFSEDITAYWLRDGGFDFPALGRNNDLGLADMGRATFLLDNIDARFSPDNTGSPYSPDFHTYHKIKATITINAVTYDVFYGIITSIHPESKPTRQTCTVQATDLMYVLSRTDIRCPLMQGYTGPIINRLIDYAEDGELVDNPRFDDLQLLGGYTAMGTAGIGRATVTRPILEGNASLAVSAASGNDGVRYTFGANLNGDKCTLVAYVMARPDSSAEGNVYIQAQDNIGVVATGTDTAITSGKWTRLSVSGTYAGATQYLQVRRSAASGSPDFVVGAVHATPFVSAVARSIDDGQTWLDAYSYPRGKALNAIQEVTENELGALFYFDGAGTAIFEDKAHRWVSPHTVSQGTFNERGIPHYTESAADRVKEVILDFPRYVEGADDTQLWELDRAPISIPASGSVSFEVDWGGGQATSVTLPTATTDYLANGSPDGGGADETGNLLVTVWNDWGAGAEVTLENQQTYPIYLTMLRIRGKPIREASDRTPARATGSAAPALAATLSHRYSLNGHEASVQSWASYLANRYDGPQPNVALDMAAPWPDSNLAHHFTNHALGRKVSDRITWGETTLASSLKVSRQWYIDRITRRITGDALEWTWDLVPVEQSFFIIGTSTIGGSDVLGP